MIEIGAVWKQTSKKGETYLAGKLGNAKLIILANDKKGNEKAPDYRILVAEPANSEEGAAKQQQPKDDLLF